MTHSVHSGSMTNRLREDIAKGIWANQELWVLPVEDRRDWDTMTDDAKRQYRAGADTALFLMGRWLEEANVRGDGDVDFIRFALLREQD